MPSPAYSKWTRAQLRTSLRNELADPVGRWWSDGELNGYIEDWQNEVQQETELVWGTQTKVTAISTFTLSHFNPTPLRLDLVYFNNWPLAGRTIPDLETLMREWRSQSATTDPKAIFQRDSETFSIWPPLSDSGTLVMEYPKLLSFYNNDSNTLGLPAWTQWGCKYYGAYKAFLRSGPNNNLNKALRYKKMHEGYKNWIRTFKDRMLPTRYPQLKPYSPTSHYEAYIITPQMLPNPNSGIGSGDVMVILNFNSYGSDFTAPFNITGTIDGVNNIFTLPVGPDKMQLYKNGQLMSDGPGGDYTLAGFTITFAADAIPQTGDRLVAWVYTL